jgi:hypothetical protein
LAVAEPEITDDQIAKSSQASRDASSPWRRSYPQTSVAMTEQHDGAKERKTRELLAALLDALKHALLALHPQTLFVTDAEMIRRIGIPEKIARAAIRALDENPSSRFPKKSALWGNRRYWPAVEVWFQEQHDLETGPEPKKLR